MASTDHRPTVDFDLHSTWHRDHWVEDYEHLRATCPVAFTEHNGGHWIVSRHAGVAAVARDDALFASDNDVEGTRNGYRGIVTPPSMIRSVPIEMDPPEFIGYRRMLNPFFAPSTLKRWEPVIQHHVDECLDAVIESGTIDFVYDLGSPVPAKFTLEFLGLPVEDWEIYAGPAHEIAYTPSTSPDYPGLLEGMMAMQQRFAEAVADRRANPRDDFITAMTRAEVDGAPLPHENIIGILSLIIFGGFDTTTALLSQALVWLNDHHDHRQRLIDDPELLPLATEEFLRYFTITQALTRTVTTDVVFEGQQLRAGDRVVMVWASANRDPDVFENPDEFVLDRFPNRHTAFGLGIHRCIGSNLARLDFMVMLREVLRRMPDYEIDTTRARRYPTVDPVNGYINVPATFTPSTRLNSN